MLRLLLLSLLSSLVECVVVFSKSPFVDGLANGVAAPATHDIKDWYGKGGTLSTADIPVNRRAIPLYLKAYKAGALQDTADDVFKYRQINSYQVRVAMGTPARYVYQTLDTGTADMLLFNPDILANSTSYRFKGVLSPRHDERTTLNLFLDSRYMVSGIATASDIVTIPYSIVSDPSCFSSPDACPTDSLTLNARPGYSQLPFLLGSEIHLLDPPFIPDISPTSYTVTEPISPLAPPIQRNPTQSMLSFRPLTTQQAQGLFGLAPLSSSLQAAFSLDANCASLLCSFFHRNASRALDDIQTTINGGQSIHAAGPSASSSSSTPSLPLPPLAHRFLSLHLNGQHELLPPSTSQQRSQLLVGGIDPMYSQTVQWSLPTRSSISQQQQQQQQQQQPSPLNNNGSPPTTDSAAAGSSNNSGGGGGGGGGGKANPTTAYHEFSMFDLSLCGVNLNPSSQFPPLRAIVDSGSSCLTVPSRILSMLVALLPIYCEQLRPHHTGLPISFSSAPMTQCTFISSLDNRVFPVAPLSFSVRSPTQASPLTADELLFLSLSGLFYSDPNKRNAMCLVEGVSSIPQSTRTSIDRPIGTTEADLYESYDPDNTIILGTMAMQSFYTIFSLDTRQVGLANKAGRVKDVQCKIDNRCIGMQERSETFNTCIDPTCDAYYLFDLNLETKECEIPRFIHALLFVVVSFTIVCELILEEFQIKLQANCVDQVFPSANPDIEVVS